MKRKPSPCSYLKEREHQLRKDAPIGEDRTAGREFPTLPFNADETCPEPMRRALLDGTAPDQTGRGLAVAHHYRTINHYHVTGEAPPHAGGFPPPQARPGETKNEISAGRPTNPPS